MSDFTTEYTLMNTDEKRLSKIPRKKFSFQQMSLTWSLFKYPGTSTATVNYLQIIKFTIYYMNLKY